MRWLSHVLTRWISWLTGLWARGAVPRPRRSPKAPASANQRARYRKPNPVVGQRRRKATAPRAAQGEAHCIAMRKYVAEKAAAARIRRIKLGIREYRWLAMDVHGTCEVAKRNGGKVFSHDEPPPEGHVGEGRCGSPDFCRCVATAIIPGLDD